MLDLWFGELTILSSTLHFVLPFGPETSGSREDSVSKEGSDPKGACASALLSTLSSSKGRRIELETAR